MYAKTYIYFTIIFWVDLIIVRHVSYVSRRLRFQYLYDTVLLAWKYPRNVKNFEISSNILNAKSL